MTIIILIIHFFTLFSTKDEAFALWNTNWAKLYKSGSRSQEIIKHISDTYYLVNLVDNDYVAGNCLFEILGKVLEKTGKPRLCPSN